MRLADFILSNSELILVEWEAFARNVWPREDRDPHELRDHAADILAATAWDMKSAQTVEEQTGKSQGAGSDGATSARVDGASDVHAVARVRSGFDVMAVIAEYRALRASVVRLWRESQPTHDSRDLEDLTRFNESIDQSLTEAVRSYTQMVDQSRQMFLAILGHDLRNPLNSMMMSAQLLVLTGEQDIESKALASQILASSAAMGQMISDLLDFTGSGLGAQMPLSPTAMDVGELCREVVDEVHAAYPQRALNLEQHGDLTGQWDRARLRQVVSNLLGNAIHHGAETEPVNLRVTTDGGEVLLSFQNGGAPIPRDLMPTLFEPLVRDLSPESQRKRRPGSIGLGLHIAREVVLAHKGTIHVESSAETGTVFSVRLPRTAS